MSNILFSANNTIGTGLSGGERIFTQFIKNWKDKIKITLMGSEEAIKIAKREGVKGINFIQTDSINKTTKQQAIITQIFHTVRRTFFGIYSLYKYKKEIKQTNYIYNVSDFYPDLIPAFLTKLFRPKTKWLCGYYLIAPAPWDKTSPYRDKSPLKGIFYWLMQLPTFFITKKSADKILVTSQDEKQKFIRAGTDPKKIIVVRGGVDTKPSEAYLNSDNIIPKRKRKYDACFVGRFHEQKGVLGLIDIWNLVVEQKPNVRLAMIGDGMLFDKAKKKINQLQLSSNIDLLGFMIKKPKHEIFKQSKMVLHPATFDSGGMAAAEAMAWKLPAVGYDLPALKTYYPQGMLKAELNNKQKFAVKILLLLNDPEIYNKTKQQAYQLIQTRWKWEERAKEIYKQIFNE